MPSPSKVSNTLSVFSWEKALFEHYRYGWNLTDQCTQVYIKEPADNAYLRKF